VYGPNDDGERRFMWDELVGLISWWELLWCIGGDYKFGFRAKNQVTSDTLQLRRIFSDFIFEQGLLDIPLVGGNLLGRIIEDCRCGLELIDFFYL
jgi:hypothetical protein